MERLPTAKRVTLMETERALLLEVQHPPLQSGTLLLILGLEFYPRPHKRVYTVEGKTWDQMESAPSRNNEKAAQ